MNIYATIVLEFLLISFSILILFKYRKKIGLAPLFILLGAVQYLQALSATMIKIVVLDKFTLYPGSVILFSAVLFAVLLIYIKEGVNKARILILGIIFSNFLLALFFEITYQQELIVGQINDLDEVSIFFINHKFFIVGTIILLLDFFLLVVIYQYLVSKKKQLPYFFTLFTALLLVLIFDAFAINISLKLNSPDFSNSLFGHLIGKSIIAFIFSVILYFYLKYFDIKTEYSTFIANQKRDIFSIIKYQKKYLDLKVEKEKVENKLTSKLETTLNNISDGFVTLDTNWCYTYLNKKAGDFLGRSPESLIGKHIWTEFPEGVGLPFYDAYYKAVETQKTIYFKEYYKPLDKWFENRIYPTPDGLSIYFTDISNRVNFENKIKEIQNKLESAIRIGKIGYWSWDIVKDEVFWSDLMYEIYDVKIGTPLKYDTVIDCVHPEDRDFHNDLVEQRIKNKSDEPFEYRVLCKDKTIKYVMVQMEVIENDQGEAIKFQGTVIDVTRLKKAKMALQESENRLMTILETEPECIKQLNAKGELIYINPAGLKMIDADNLEMITGHSIINLIMPEHQKAFKNLNAQVFKGHSGHLEFQIKSLKGVTRWLETHAVPLKNKDGKIISLLGITRDVTERRKAEMEILRLGNRNTKIINTVIDGFILADVQGRILDVNPAYINMVGYNKEELLAMNINQLEAKLNQKEIDNRIKEMVSKGFTRFKSTHRKKNGEIINLEVSTSIMQFNEDNVVAAFVKDITEQLEKEKALKETEERYRLLAEKSIDALFMADANFKFTYVNNRAIELLGYSYDEFLQLTIPELTLLEPGDPPLMIGDKSKGLENIHERKMICKDGSILQVDISGKKLEDGSYMAFVRDITERKKTEKELEKHRNNLEELVELRTTQLEKEKIKAQSADLMKSAFLATMSHELRTPMNSIIGFTSILLKEYAGPLNDEQKKQLNMVKNSGNHLLNLINDVLDISKIEAGTLITSQSEFDFINTVQETIDFLIPQASKKEITIYKNYDKSKILLHSDERRVEQILLNLISNAIKFSSNGSINVNISIVDDMVLTQIKDEGIGISSKDLKKLFIPFIQVDGGLSRNHEGTGLGLAISKNLVEKLGGTIKAESTLGKGSTFSFTLPL